MKKAILAIAIALASLACFSQDFRVNVYQVDVLTFNPKTEGYDLYKSFYPENMHLAKQGNIITVDNQDESNYRIGKELEETDSECRTFLATDKNEESVGLQVCLHRAENQGSMSVVYLDKMAVVYYLKP